MFFFKKLVSRFLFPVPLCAGLLVAGLVLLLFTKRQKLGKGLLVAGTTLFLALSFPWLSVHALGSLERTYPAATDPRSLLPQPVATNVFVAVLGQSVSADTNLPVNLRFNPEFLTRLLEAGRLQRLLPGSQLLVSVAGNTIDANAKRRVLAEFYGMLGVGSNNITLYGDALDSEGEIAYFKTQAGTNPVFLVSSGSHLPRAMFLARTKGLNAIPAPCLYQVDFSPDTQSPFNPAGLFPGAENLALAERAVYEYLGWLFVWLRN